MRIGCSLSAGNKSKIPPRTAKSPLRSTRSDREYPNFISNFTNSDIIKLLLLLIVILVELKSFEIIGCKSALTEQTTTLVLPLFILYSALNRAVTVSGLGLNLSCGKVSQAGKLITLSAPIQDDISDESSTACRFEVVTTKSGKGEFATNKLCTDDGAIKFSLFLKYSPMGSESELNRVITFDPFS